MKTIKKYDKYKNSGVEWLGEIPEHWEVKKLKYIGKIYAGINGKKGEDFSKEYKEGLKPFIPFTVINNNLKIIEDNYDYVKISEFENQNKVEKNDILFLMSSETIEDIGKNSIYLGSSKELYLNSFCKGFRLKKENLYPEYINYLLFCSLFRNYFSVFARGFTRINLKQEYINNAYVFLPPLAEQTAIANFLDEKTAKIDKAIANKQKLIDLLKERKQIIIQNAVTKGLNPNAKMKNSGIDWIGDIPEHWEVKRLKYVFDKIKTGTTPPTINKKYFNGGINWYNPKDLNNEILINSEKTISELAIIRNQINYFNKDAILIVGIGATTGKTSYMPEKGTFNQQITGFHSYKEFNKYYFYLLKSMAKVMLNIANYTTLPILNNEFFKTFWLIKPPLNEQEAIVEYIESETAKIDKAINLQEKQIEKLKEYKTILIDNAVTGKIKVS